MQFSGAFLLDSFAPGRHHVCRNRSYTNMGAGTYIMLTMEAAGAVLIVAVGIGMLVLLCCAALIYAKTHLVPHSDCRRFNEGVKLQVDELFEKFKHRGKQAGGRVRGAQKKIEAEEAEAEAEAEGATRIPTAPVSNFEEIRRRVANGRGY